MRGLRFRLGFGLWLRDRDGHGQGERPAEVALQGVLDMRAQFDLEDPLGLVIHRGEEGVAVIYHERLRELEVDALVVSERGHGGIRTLRSFDEIGNDGMPRLAGVGGLCHDAAWAPGGEV